MSTVRALLTVLVFATLAVATPAAACAASGPDGYVSGLIWQNRPSQIPDDAFAMRVRYKENVPGAWAFIVTVLDGPPNMEGRDFRVVPENLNSCVGLGQQEGHLVVRRTTILVPTIDGPREFLAAVDFEPTFWNEVQRIFGGSPWRYPGHVAEPLGLPE